MISLVTLTRGGKVPKNGVQRFVGGDVRWVLKRHVSYQEYTKEVINAFSLPGWVALVDDDDELLDLRPVQEAVKNHPEAGLIFTKERGRPRAKVLGDLPLAVHHLALVRTDALNKELMLKYPYAADAVAKISAGMSAGAVFVNQECYLWKKHPGQLHRDPVHRPLLLRDLKNSMAELKSIYTDKLSDPIKEA